MSVRVLFFASLKDAVGTDALSLTVSGPTSLDALLALLAERLDAEGLAALKAENVRLAINQELTTGSVVVHPGDEVAFLPPVTGG